MATVQTDLTPEIIYTGYGGVPDTNRDVSYIPRGHLTAHIFGGVVPLSGIGDNQLVRIDAVLPINYAYAIVDLQVSIVADSGLTMGFMDSGLCRWENVSSGGSRDIVIDFELQGGNDVTMGTGPTVARAYGPVGGSKEIFNSILVSHVNGLGPALLTQFFNLTANDIAYSVQYYAKFLQFDVLQVSNWEVNAPLPTR